MIPDYNLEKDDREILKREYCEGADKIRKTMVLMSYYKYGPARKNFAEGRVDAFKSAEECMQAFKKDKNTEHLLDAMNYLMFRYMYPLPGEHYMEVMHNARISYILFTINASICFLYFYKRRRRRLHQRIQRV